MEKNNRLKQVCTEKLENQKKKDTVSLIISGIISIAIVVGLVMLYTNPEIDNTGKIGASVFGAFIGFFSVITFLTSLKTIKKETDDFQLFEHFSEDFEDAKEIGAVFITKNRIYKVDSTVHVVELNDIVWAYCGSDAEVETANGRNPFNKRRVELFGVHVFTGPDKYVNKTTYHTNKEDGASLIREIAENANNALIGMNDLYRKTYFKDYENLSKLKDLTKD